MENSTRSHQLVQIRVQKAVKVALEDINMQIYGILRSAEKIKLFLPMCEHIRFEYKLGYTMHVRFEYPDGKVHYSEFCVFADENILKYASYKADHLFDNEFSKLLSKELIKTELFAASGFGYCAKEIHVLKEVATPYAQNAAETACKKISVLMQKYGNEYTNIAFAPGEEVVRFYNAEGQIARWEKFWDVIKVPRKLRNTSTYQKLFQYYFLGNLKNMGFYQDTSGTILPDGFIYNLSENTH